MLEIINKQTITKYLSPEIRERLNLSKQAANKIEAAASVPSSKMPTTNKQPPKLELKPLPEHLKYTFLEAHAKQPFIIAQNLQPH